jgi:hypothetical protein
MLSRNLNTSPFFSISRADYPASHDLHPTNIERWFVLQMVCVYDKLKFDIIWLEILQRIDERIKNYMTLSSAAFIEWQNSIKLRDEVIENYNTQQIPLSTEQFEIVKFVQAREYECKLNYDIQEKKVNQDKMRMCSYLYYPLLQCVNSLMKYHKCRNGYCSFKDNNQWNLSKILLYIFKTYPLSIGYDDFSKWSSLNIFRHPIIQLCEERMKINIVGNNLLRGQKKFLSSTNNVFHELCILYDNYVVHVIIRMLLNDKLQFPIETWKVWNLSSTGGKILQFLIDPRSLRQICFMYGIPIIN